MLKPFPFKYISPTKYTRCLSVLLSIHNTPDISQHKIAKRSNLSSSMVNNYIKQLKQANIITVEGETNRTLSYHLTPQGQNKLNEALASFSVEIMQLYSFVKHEIAQILQGYYDEGIRTLVLFGVAETAEVVHAAIKRTPLVVIGTVDSDKSKHGTPFYGFVIQPPEHIKQIKPDAVLITSFSKQEEIHNCIRQISGDCIPVKKIV
jgi:DNA-binding MarR family transcriptional regulator